MDAPSMSKPIESLGFGLDEELDKLFRFCINNIVAS